MNWFEEVKTFEELLHDLEGLSENIVLELGLPNRGVIVNQNIGKGKNNTGDVISYSVCISEPAYPATKEEMEDEKRTQTPIVTIQAPTTKKWSGFVIFSVDKFVSELIDIPEDFELLPRNAQDNGSGKQRIRVAISSKNLLLFMDKLIRHRINTYFSGADSFGCCDLYEKCSDMKRCVHENLLYSTACAYRHNLESGRIFYGKNKNV